MFRCERYLAPNQLSKSAVATAVCFAWPSQQGTVFPAQPPGRRCAEGCDYATRMATKRVGSGPPNVVEGGPSRSRPPARAATKTKITVAAVDAVQGHGPTEMCCSASEIRCQSCAPVLRPAGGGRNSGSFGPLRPFGDIGVRDVQDDRCPVGVGQCHHGGEDGLPDVMAEDGDLDLSSAVVVGTDGGLLTGEKSCQLRLTDGGDRLARVQRERCTASSRLPDGRFPSSRRRRAPRRTSAEPVASAGTGSRIAAPGRLGRRFR